MTQADLAGRQIDEIVPSFVHVSHLMEQISGACSEQSVGMDQIRASTEQFALISQQNADTSEKTSVESRMLKSLADDLQAQVSQFRLRVQTSVSQSDSTAGQRAVRESGYIPGGNKVELLPTKINGNGHRN